MLNNPPVVLLDEPSSGQDPKTKRFMWLVNAAATISALEVTFHRLNLILNCKTLLGTSLTPKIRPQAPAQVAALKLMLKAYSILY